MKNITIIALLLVFAIGVVASQEVLSPAQQRKAERAKQDQIQLQKIERAIEDKTFYFLGQSMQTRSFDRYFLRAPYNYVDLQPGYIRVQLPYFTSQNTMGNAPLIVDFESENFTFKATEKRGVYTVVIEVHDVRNTYVITRKTPSGSYRLVFTISTSRSGGNATLSLTPNFTSTISYDGDLEVAD